jgi:hypothetical protein
MVDGVEDDVPADEATPAAEDDAPANDDDVVVERFLGDEIEVLMFFNGRDGEKGLLSPTLLVEEGNSSSRRDDSCFKIGSPLSTHISTNPDKMMHKNSSASTGLVATSAAELSIDDDGCCCCCCCVPADLGYCGGG